MNRNEYNTKQSVKEELQKFLNLPELKKTLKKDKQKQKSKKITKYTD